MSLRTYRLEKRLAEGIVKLMWHNGSDIWTRGHIRGRAKKCVVTGVPMKPGQRAWRPITNGHNRMDRISDSGIKQLEDCANAEAKRDKR